MTFLASGCATLSTSWDRLFGREPAPTPAPRVVRPTPTPEFFVHEILWRGQTLGEIAKWYTGDFGNWEKLAKPVNPELTQCCVSLRVGRRVKIPLGLLVTTDPMPRTRRETAPPPPPTTEPTPSPTPLPEEMLPPIIGPRL